MDNCSMHGTLLILTFCDFCFHSSLNLRMFPSTNCFLLSSHSLLLLVEIQLLDNSPQFSSRILRIFSSGDMTWLLGLTFLKPIPSQ